ncbi:hypothetical protein [Granulicella sibirica]|nr:hypothetical protein [Granulicella sibirica]
METIGLNHRVFLSKTCFGAAGALACLMSVGCGSGGTLLPGTNSSTTKPVPGAPAGPNLGYIWSGTDGSLRPIQGVSGSAVVGQSIVATGTYVAGAASAASGLGLVEDSTGSLFVLDLPSSTPAFVTKGLPSQATIIFSPNGGEAVAYGAGGTSVTVLSNLATKPQANQVGMPGGSKLAGAAVSDAGTVLVATQASPVVVGTLSASGVVSRLTTVAQAGGMSFLAGAEDALVADAAGNTVSLLHNVSGTLNVQSLGAAGVNQPLAVQGSQDARWAVVANGGDHNVLWIDLKNGGAPAKLTCSCQATELSLLAGGKTFRLNELGDGPLWMADLTGSTPQLLFVPAVK